ERSTLKDLSLHPAACRPPPPPAMLDGETRCPPNPPEVPVDTRRTRLSVGVALKFVAAVALLAAAAGPARAGVVINEILYHAPDDLDELQFVELHNPGDKAVDLAGWKLARAVRYEFPAGTSLAPGGYLVVCKDPKEFRRFYGSDAAGRCDGSLPHD